MELETFCVAPDELLFSQIRENCASVRTWAKSVPAHDGHAVLVGGGPSMRGKLWELKKRQELGQTIFALNGAAGFLNSQGLLPDFQVLLDPQEQLALVISNAKKYLVASQCHPSVVRALPDPVLWHLAVDGAEDQIPAHHDDFCLVGGGLTVGLSAMCLAYSMGYRKLHLFGYDSSAAADGDHAYTNHVDTAAVFHGESNIVVTVNGKDFNTSVAFAKQAVQLPKLCNDLIDHGCLITINCDGLGRAMIEEANRHPAGTVH